MAQKAETVFRANFMKRVKRALPEAWFESIQQQTILGTPDVVGCIRGAFVALEFKRSKKANIGKLQSYKKQCILQAEGVCFIVYPENADEIFQLLIEMGEPYHDQVDLGED